MASHYQGSHDAFNMCGFEYHDILWLGESYGLLILGEEYPSPHFLLTEIKIKKKKSEKA